MISQNTMLSGTSASAGGLAVSAAMSNVPA